MNTLRIELRTSAFPGGKKTACLICPNDVGIEDEAIERSCGHSDVAFQHGYNEYNPYQWDEKKNVDIGTLHAQRCS